MQNEPNKERRLFRRFDMGLEVEIEIDGAAQPGKVFDLSFGGASLSPADEAWKGKSIKIRNPGFGPGIALQGDIVNVVQERCHIRFELDDTAEEALTFFMMTTDETR